MQNCLCHCSEHRNPPISAVGSPDLPAVPASPKYSPEFHTPSIEVRSLGTVSSAPSTLDPIPVPPPVTSPLPSSDAENIPPACCSNPPPPHTPLVPIEEVMSDAEDCQECYKNSALFTQFLLSPLTYVLLSYFIRLHCANIHTPLPFLSYPYDFQNMKTRHSSLFCAKEDL